jgi:hypothetical protein
MFQKERFIEECRAALKERDTHAAIRELVATAVSEPAHIVRALGAAACRRRDDLQGRRFDYPQLVLGTPDEV